jgi:hypothetical protein
MYLQEGHAESENDDTDIEEISMELLIRTTYPIYIYISTIEEYRDKWETYQSEHNKSMPLHL